MEGAPGIHLNSSMEESTDTASTHGPTGQDMKDNTVTTRSMDKASRPCPMGTDCSGEKGGKEIPYTVDLVVGFVVLSLIVYFGISLFYFILTKDSVSEKLVITLERGVTHVLATVCPTVGDIDRQGTEHGKTPMQMDFRGEKETKENSEQEFRTHIIPLLEEVYRMMSQTRPEVQQLNQRHRHTEETRLNQDIQIGILRQEIKSMQTHTDFSKWLLKLFSSKMLTH